MSPGVERKKKEGGGTLRTGEEDEERERERKRGKEEEKKQKEWVDQARNYGSY